MIATANLRLGRFLVLDSGLLTHRADDGDEQLLAIIKVGLHLVAQLTIWHLDVILGRAVLFLNVHEISTRNEWK